jgi:hypothetical protein
LTIASLLKSAGLGEFQAILMVAVLKRYRLQRRAWMTSKKQVRLEFTYRRRVLLSRSIFWGLHVDGQLLSPNISVFIDIWNIII